MNFKNKITRLLKLFGFLNVGHKYRKSFKLFFSFRNLVHSQIWLNLPKDDRQFSYIFLCMTITKATLKKNTGVDRRMGGRPPAQQRRVLISQTVVPPAEEKTGGWFSCPLTRFCQG
jgi:hypothetical protein